MTHPFDCRMERGVLYAMIISLILTFSMLGLAKRLPDPYWNLLLHLHEAPLAVFLFCAIGTFLRGFEAPPAIRFRGRNLPNPVRLRTPWTLLISLLMGSAAVTYRFASLKAFVAYRDEVLLAFDPWRHRGNVFALTIAILAATISMAHLRDSSWRRKILAYASALAALVSFSPLLMPLGYGPGHPYAIGLTAILAAVLYLSSNGIQKKWGILKKREPKEPFTS